MTNLFTYDVEPKIKQVYFSTDRETWKDDPDSIVEEKANFFYVLFIDNIDVRDVNGLDIEVEKNTFVWQSQFAHK